MRSSLSNFSPWLRPAIALVAGVYLCSATARDTFPNVALPSIPKRSVVLTNCGGIGDGKTLNTDAFRDAIAQLSKKGGGKLVVPPGIWFTGPIKLASKINLHLERGALIQFSGNHKLYPLTVIDMKGEKDLDSTSPISGENLEDVAITGEGIIDGGGEAWRPVKKSKLTEGEWKAILKSGGTTNEKGDMWWPSFEAMAGGRHVGQLQRQGSLKVADYEQFHQFLRPRMVRLTGCKKVLIEDVTLQNPPNWTLNPSLCEDVSILNVKIFNSPTAQNSDALDLESCRRAVIRGCVFDVGDDGICLKSGKDVAGRRIGVPTEDVLVENCTVYHAHGGFTIGSEMSGGVRNVRVRNCTFMGTDIGLRFKTTRGRGGVVENIDISGIRMSDIHGDAINFNMYYGGSAPLDEAQSAAPAAIPSVSEETPQFRDIQIRNVVCRGAQKAIVLQGLPELAIRNISFKNVSMTSEEGVFVTDAEAITFDDVEVEHKTGPVLNKTRVKNSKLDLLK